MRGSSFTFDHVDLLEYHLNKIRLNRGSSYIKSPEWIKNKGVYCLNCFHPYTTEKKFRKHERICRNHDFCHPKMPDEYKILKYIPGEKSLKVPFIIYADLECLL